MKDSAVYLAAGTFGVSVVNAANPDTPFVTVSNLGMKPARDFHILGNFMFTAVSEQGVNIAEISYPTEPDIRGGLSTIGYAYGLTTSADSNYLFAACGEMGLSIYDISNFRKDIGIYPQVGWCDTPGDAEAIWILDNEKDCLFSLWYRRIADHGLFRYFQYLHCRQFRQHRVCKGPDL